MYGAAPRPDFIANSPLAFEANHGQWTTGASFGTHAAGFSAAFEPTGIMYSLISGEKRARVKMLWRGANSSLVEPLDHLPGTANYYFGNDPARWISSLATYRKLQIKHLYQGIDVVFYGDSQQLEYDLIVAPHADPNRIGIVFEGGKARLTANGDLVVATAAGEFLQHRPVAYQELAGQRFPVEAGYLLGQHGDVTLRLGKYDLTRALVIDPTIAWTQSLGSGNHGTGQANAVALDAAGNVIVAGTTSATDFPQVNGLKPTLGGAADAFLTKFSPDGTILYSTYFGGSNAETGTGLAVDVAGEAILVGSTNSANLPTKNPYQATLRGIGNAFVAKFSQSGALLYGTYLGGSATDAAAGVAVDIAGNAYITGATTSVDFPVQGAFQSVLKGGYDGFVTKLSADGSALLFSTYFGGNDNDLPTAIALGPGNAVYVTGSSHSFDYPTTPNAYLTVAQGGLFAFVTCFAPSGASLLYSTYLATVVSGPQSYGIDVDASGAAYVTGFAHDGYPTKNAYQYTPIGPTIADNASAFLTKLTPDGSAQVYSTYLGGLSSNEQGLGVRVDASGNATVVGFTQSNDFPTVAAFRPQSTGQDGFVTKFNSTGNNVLFSSFIGGNGTDVASSANALAIDANGNTFVVGTSSALPGGGSNPVGKPFVAKLSGTSVSLAVTFASVPAGLHLIVDGVTFTAPATFLWAPGVSHQLDVPSAQASLSGSGVDTFFSWSNGGSKAQAVMTPAAPMTFTALLLDQPCTYSFSPSSATYGEAGVTNASTNFITQAGCNWGVSISVPWISISRTTLFTGPTTLVYSVSPNPSGGTRTGTITAGDAVFTITQSDAAPTVVNTTTGNSGISQTFSYTVTDADGVSDLTVTNLLINSAIDGRQACYLAVDHANNVLYLVNDAGNNLLPGLMFDANGHSSGGISNSQCSVDGSKTSLVNLSATQVSVQLAVTFTSAFGGNKVLYFAARDKGLNNTGWLAQGTWNVPATTTYPNVVSVTATSIAAGTPTTLAATYQDATDNTNLTPSQILINSAIDGRNACYVGYDHKNNLLYLVDDQGANLLAAITPGVGTGTQQNSQCTIYAQTSSVQSSGKNYTLTLGVAFQAAFKGTKIVYAATQTTSGGNTGWQPMSIMLIQ